MVLVNVWLANCSHSSTHTKIHCCLCCGCKDAIKLIFPLPTDEPEGNSVTAATPAMERQHCLWSQGLCVQTFPQPVWQTAPIWQHLAPRQRRSSAREGPGSSPPWWHWEGHPTAGLGSRVPHPRCHTHTATPLHTWETLDILSLRGVNRIWQSLKPHRDQQNVQVCGKKKSMNLHSAEI